MNKKKTGLLVETCIYILACSELDYEATIGGNGVNAFENVPLADWILTDLVGLDSKTIEELIAEERKELDED